MLKQTSVGSCVVVVVFAGQLALAGPVLELNSDLMGIPRGGIVVNQQPDLGGGPAADTDYISGNGSPYWQLEADNIRLSEFAVIRRVRWWGFYGLDSDQTTGAHDPPSGSETMRIRLYSARASDGLPDNSDILFEESFVNPSRMATGRALLLPGIPAEYLFTVDLGSSLNLMSNVNYWLEVVQVGDAASLFRWQQAIGAIPGHAFSNPIVPNWQATSGSFAFQLSTIPEPSSLALVLSMITLNALWACGGRRVSPR